MSAAIEIMAVLLLALSMGLALPILCFAVECLAALLPAWRKADREDRSQLRPSIAVLIPAHNEQEVIASTLAEVLKQVTDRDLVCVVADHCSDATSQIARETDATVLERYDEDRRGKGFALEFGLEYLKQQPPRDVLVMLDADCTVQAGALEELARQAHESGKPVQGCYVMEAPRHPSTRDVISQFAVTVKNLVRPRGMQRFGLPVLLTGSGMAFPWRIARELDLGSSHLVEDMQLACDLILEDRGAEYCEEAKVVAALPTRSRAAKTQRTRWEQGHLRVSLTQIPRLAGAALRRGRWSLLATCCDLSVPPVSLLVVVWFVAWVLSLGVAMFNPLPFVLLSCLGGLMFAAVLGAWLRFSRRETPWQAVIRIPGYVLFKIPVYIGFLLHRQREWIRTERG